MKEILNIGLAQIDIIDGQIEQNKNNIERMIFEASKKGLDIICLPELCMTGYDFKLIKNTQTHDLTQTFFSSMSKKYGIATVAGITNLEGGKLYDSVGMWDSKGEIVHIHNKLQLWGRERVLFDIGDSITTVDYKGWKTGIAVCADCGFPEISRIFAIKGAEILFFPSAWISPYENLWELMLRARAAENQLFTVGINRIGRGIEDYYFGNSLVVDPSGNPVCRFPNSEEMLIVAKVSRQSVAERRKEIPWLEYRVPRLYKDIINHHKDAC